MSHEAHPSASFVSGVGKLCPRPRAIADDESRITAEHVICFRGMQTVPVSARNELLTPPQRIVTQIIRDISRCPHGPVVSKFYCPGPYFYLPRDVGTCLSLSPALTNISIHALQLHVCIANVHLNSLDNIYCTFEKLFFYTLSLPLPAVSAGMAHILQVGVVMIIATM